MSVAARAPEPRRCAGSARCGDDGRSGRHRPRRDAGELAGSAPPAAAAVRSLWRAAPCASARDGSASTSRSPRSMRPAPRRAFCRRALPVRPGGRQAATPPSSRSIEAATAAVARGEASALVTNPITKKTLQSGGLPYPGHTEFLAELAARHWRGRDLSPRHDARGRRAQSRARDRAYPARRRARRAHHGRCSLETIRITAAALAERFRHRRGRASPSPGSIRMPAKAA